MTGKEVVQRVWATKAWHDEEWPESGMRFIEADVLALPIVAGYGTTVRFVLSLFGVDLPTLVPEVGRGIALITELTGSSSAAVLFPMVAEVTFHDPINRCQTLEGEGVHGWGTTAIALSLLYYRIGAACDQWPWGVPLLVGAADRAAWLEVQT